MDKNFIINAVNDYLNGKITRNELYLRVKTKRAERPFIYDQYCVYSYLILDGIEQKLSAIPEMSYNDVELRDMLDILEGKKSVCLSFVYMIPSRMIDNETRKFIEIIENFIGNFEKGKTYPIKAKVTFSDGDSRYIETETFISQENLDYCEKLRYALSNEPRNTIIKSIVWNLLSILNRFIGIEGEKITYFASSDDIGNDILSKDMKRSVRVLSGKCPVYVTLTGTIDNTNATVIL